MPAPLTHELTFVPIHQKFKVITGGAAGNHTVAGIRPEDVLQSVQNLTDNGDLTSEFTITADNVINNTGGTATTSDQLLVVYFDTPEDLDP